MYAVETRLVTSPWENRMSTKNMTLEKALNVTAEHGGIVYSGENIIYLMGGSFVVGSLFTILILILLDFMKRDRTSREPE
jgi:hypothetical protein